MHRLCVVARFSGIAPTRQLLPLSFCSAHADLSTSSFAATSAEAGDDPPGRGGSDGGDGSRGGDKVTPTPPPASSPAPSPSASSALDDPLAFLDDLGIGGPGGGDGAGGSRTRPPPPPPAAASAVASTAESAAWPAVGGGAHRRWDGPGGGGGGYGRGGDGALPDDPMFSQSATAGIPDVEVRRMAAIYRLVREHAAAASGTGPPVDADTNVLLGPRLSPIRSLPRVAPAVLAELRHQLPAADASDVLVSSGAATPPAAGAGGAAAPRDSRAAAEAALWRRVDASTMDPHSFARLVRASALAPGALAGGSDGGMGGVPGAAGAPGVATGPLPPGGVGGGGGMAGGRLSGGGGGGRSKAATKAAARAACPLSDARGRVQVDYRQVELLRGFINPSGRLLSRRAVGTTAKAQRRVSRAVKTARQMALLNPTIQTPIAYSEDRGGAGGYSGL